MTTPSQPTSGTGRGNAASLNISCRNVTIQSSASLMPPIT